MRDRPRPLTFNWFCDDHWRFDSYTRHWAPHFGHPVTTSHGAVEKYRAAGIGNVILSQWESKESFQAFIQSDDDGSLKVVDDKAITSDGSIDASTAPAWYFPPELRPNLPSPAPTAVAPSSSSASPSASPSGSTAP